VEEKFVLVLPGLYAWQHLSFFWGGGGIIVFSSNRFHGITRGGMDVLEDVHILFCSKQFVPP